jgi:hypothetical protein
MSIGDVAFATCTSLTSISYTGTVEQCKSLSEGTSWDESTHDYTIYCTDGTIAKDGTVTYN